MSSSDIRMVVGALLVLGSIASLYEANRERRAGKAWRSRAVFGIGFLLFGLMNLVWYENQPISMVLAVLGIGCVIWGAIAMLKIRQAGAP